MRKRNKVKQLQRTSSHRKAMLDNLVTSLFYHERIESTVAKAKAARILAEKIITKAKHGTAQESPLHAIRQAAKVVKSEEVLNKLFKDIAGRYAERPGGYTRIIRSGRRASDNSEMAILELVEKKELAQLKEERQAIRTARSKKSTEKAAAKPPKEKKTAKKQSK